MQRCPECDYPLPVNREQLGARCPNCHDPLYEPAGRVGRPVRFGEAACAVHAMNESLGPCRRCGQPMCEICRCAWQRELICAACAERALEAGPGPGDPGHVPTRQAGLSVVFGVLAWLLGAGGVGLAGVIGQLTGPVALLLLFVTFGLFAAAVGLAVSSLGQGTAALLVRGRHAWIATPGVVIGGLFLGALLGLLGLGAWLAG